VAFRALSSVISQVQITTFGSVDSLLLYSAQVIKGFRRASNDESAYADIKAKAEQLRSE